jgi:pimeloyl-ACP methyl ester carboxylesterase
MYFHGAPSSRLDLTLFEDAFAARDVRVVSADRPGYGGSSPQPGRRREDWPADVAALADHLGIERFAVLGLSSGGPYAVVCAALLPDRVVAAGLVRGETDVGWPGAWDGYPENEGTLMRIGDEAEATAWCEQLYGPDGSSFMEGGLGELALADQAALADEALTTRLGDVGGRGVPAGRCGIRAGRRDSGEAVVIRPGHNPRSRVGASRRSGHPDPGRPRPPYRRVDPRGQVADLAR